MTSSFNCHSIDSSGPVLPTKESDASQVMLTGRIAASAKKDTVGPSSQRNDLPSLGERIPLQKGNTEYLSTLTDAFAEVYKMMSQSVVAQINDETKLQDLDQTMSQIVLDSTNAAISKEQDLLQKSTDMQNEYNDKIDQAKDWQTVAQVVGVAVLIISIGATIATWGAAAPAAEMAAVELAEIAATSAESGGTELADLALDASFESESEGSALGEEASEGADSELNETESLSGRSNAEIEEVDSEAPEYMRETRQMMSRESSVDEQMNEQVGEDLQESDEAVDQTTDKWKNLLKKLARSTIGGATGTVYAMPYIYQSQASFFQAKYKREVAGLLTQIGPLMGTMQENNMYFQFYQQLVQRGSGFVQQLAQETGEAIEIDGTVMSAYRQLAVSLAHAV